MKSKLANGLVPQLRNDLQACIASLPIQSSLTSKTYLKSDRFNGGGSVPRGVAPVSRFRSSPWWTPVS